MVPPKPPREPSFAERLHAQWLHDRELRCTSSAELGGLDMEVCPPDDPPNWPRTMATVAQWLAIVPEPASGADREQFVRLLVTEWLEDPYWAGATKRVDGKDTGVPQPYPWNALLTERVWRPLAERLQREASAEVAA